MGAALRRTAYDELEALPEHLVGEIINGQLEVSPRPRSRHAFATGWIHRWTSPVDGAGGGGSGEGQGSWILFEPEVHLRNDVLVPDLAGWRQDRMPEMEDTAWFYLAPDWVCEVLSPSTARLDRHRKLPAYARAGVRHAWLIDVDAQTLEAYRLDGERWLLLGVWAGSEVARIEPFESMDFPLERLWLPTARKAAAPRSGAEEGDPPPSRPDTDGNGTPSTE